MSDYQTPGNEQAVDNIDAQESVTTPDDSRTAMAVNLESILPSQSISNFDGSPSNRWKLAAKGQNESVSGTNLDKNAVIHLKYWYMHRVTMVNPKTGEITNPIRSVLYDANGDMYHFVSDGIANALSQLVQAFGTGPLDPPVPVSVTTIKTRAGFTTHSLIPAE